ncbi:MAG TPA: hypothetical protein VGG54_03280 [Trebonia sp.]
MAVHASHPGIAWRSPRILVTALTVAGLPLPAPPFAKAASAVSYC